MKTIKTMKTMKTMKTYVLRMAGLASLGGLLLAAPFGVLEAADKAPPLPGRQADAVDLVAETRVDPTSGLPVQVFKLPGGAVFSLHQLKGLENISLVVLENPSGAMQTEVIEDAGALAKSSVDVRCMERCNSANPILGVFRDGEFIGFLLPDGKGGYKFVPIADHQTA